MLKIAFTSFLLFTAELIFAQSQSLFKIVEGDKVGYINSKGEVIIKPIFLSGNEFSEGLAAVRLNGLYGYINESGTFVIEPEFDYASNFVKGLAIVYKNGKPFFIDKSSKPILPPVYKGFTFLNDRKGIITTLTNKQGVIDMVTRKLIIDTIFSSIGDFKDGAATVEEYLPPSKKSGLRRTGVIDSKGKWIVPFGKYKTVKPFHEGFAEVEFDDPGNKDSSTDGLINTKGKLLFKRPYRNNNFITGDFYNGYAKVSLNKYCMPEKKGITSSSKKSYEGYINLKGEVVLNDSNYRYVKDFSNGRAFIQKDNGDFVLIGEKLNQISDQEFTDVLNDKFYNNYAIVETNEGWGIIDTDANFIVKPQYEEIDEIGIVGKHFFFIAKSDNNENLYGISDLNNKIIVEPVIQEFDRNGFVNGIIKVIIDDTLKYINEKGNIVWQEKPDTSIILRELNIDFMNRGYFYAYSTPKNTKEDESGGWATSPNTPKRIGNEYPFEKNGLAIKIDTTLIDTFDNRFYGVKLFVSNTSNDTIVFNAQDSRLYLKLQAQDEKGNWKDIEYLPSSWCGNSYHTIDLEPNAYWDFEMPSYKGAFQTKIRASLEYVDPENKDKTKVVYSNVIKGSINPGQFWNKGSYHPTGLMDPYPEYWSNPGRIYVTSTFIN